MRAINLGNHRPGTRAISRTLINKKVVDSLPEHLFDREAHRAESIASNAGRGTVIMFRHESQDMVLKTYLRGGLPSRVVEDTYLYTGLHRTRMWREFHMLQEMSEMGLPVPLPIAARCQMKTHLSYRGELIMTKINNANTLAEVIARCSLSDATWSRIGEVIARFHSKRVFHHDLNANNILLTRDRGVYLIDFDKCYFRSTRGMAVRQWQRANLGRLEKSLNKLSIGFDDFNFDSSKWERLAHGYESPAAEFDRSRRESSLTRLIAPPF